MVDDYIKRKYVLEGIKASRDGIDLGQSEDGDAFLHYSACLYRTIASNECFPSADVVEVKHGKWEIIWLGYSNTYRCSICKFKFNHTDNYCPNCGARMKHE